MGHFMDNLMQQQFCFTNLFKKNIIWILDQIQSKSRLTRFIGYIILDLSVGRDRAKPLSSFVLFRTMLHSGK